MFFIIKVYSDGSSILFTYIMCIPPITHIEITLGGDFIKHSMDSRDTQKKIYGYLGKY